MTGWTAFFLVMCLVTGLMVDHMLIRWVRFFKKTTWLHDRRIGVIEVVYRSQIETLRHKVSNLEAQAEYMPRHERGECVVCDARAKS